LEQAKQERATLLIAKLDRLARNVAFISRLLESGVDLICCDMPQANKLTLHILAAVAEHEREMISERTKAALAAAKARGVKLGAPSGYDPTAARQKRSETASAFHQRVRPDVAKLAGQGLSLRAIAAELNRLGLPTSRGKTWHPAGVRRILTGD
jgi:DNA invertase Pin-like site-specific DNA recombinase